LIIGGGNGKPNQIEEPEKPKQHLMTMERK
jgi:hypothetical protein